MLQRQMLVPMFRVKRAKLWTEIDIFCGDVLTFLSRPLLMTLPNLQKRESISLEIFNRLTRSLRSGLPVGIY